MFALSLTIVSQGERQIMNKLSGFLWIFIIFLPSDGCFYLNYNLAEDNIEIMGCAIEAVCHRKGFRETERASLPIRGSE